MDFQTNMQPPYGWPDTQAEFDRRAYGTGVDAIDFLIGSGKYSPSGFSPMQPEYTAQYLAYERKRAATRHLTGFRRTPLLRFSLWGLTF